MVHAATLLHMCRDGFDLMGLLTIRQLSLLVFFGQEEDMLNLVFSMAELQSRCADQGVSASDTTERLWKVDCMCTRPRSQLRE